MTRKKEVTLASGKPKSGKTKPVWVLNVVSSNIAQAKYKFTKHQLMIEFKGGARYVYHDVSVLEFMEFSRAESQGKWFAQHIKGKKRYDSLD